jgi:hypothetical protein
MIALQMAGIAKFKVNEWITRVYIYNFVSYNNLNWISYLFEIFVFMLII